MKKAISAILIALVLCLSFTGCIGGEVKQTNEELTIWYEGDYANVYFREAIKKYQILYPEIKLNIVNVDVDITSNWFDEFAKKLSTAVMSGKGPDIVQLGILTTGFGDLVSIPKMIKSGVFADLAEFYDNDTELDKNDLYKTVMDAGVFDEKRYFIPVQFKVPWLVTNREQIEKSGVDLSKCDTYNNFIDETTPMLKKWINGETDVKLFGRNRALAPFYYHNGMKYIDFFNQKINFNDEEFKKWMEYYKLVYTQVPSFDGSTQEEEFWTPFPDDPIGVDNVFEDLSLFPCGRYFNSALQSQKEAILLPVRNDDGTVPIKLQEMYAINAKSENKQNAWDFIKITMAPNFFSNNTIEFMYIPISKKATASKLEGIKILPNDVYNTYIKTLENLSAEEPFSDPAQYDVFNLMKPYFDDEKDYEVCLKELKEKLELYVSE